MEEEGEEDMHIKYEFSLTRLSHAILLLVSTRPDHVCCAFVYRLDL